MFQTNVVGKIKTHILFSVSFFRKSCRLLDSFEKYGGVRDATEDSKTGRMRFACWISKATRAHACARAHTHTQTQRNM